VWQQEIAGRGYFLWNRFCGLGGMLEKGKGCDIGYAPAASSCERAFGVDACTVTALDAITAFAVQTPTTPRRAVGFFRSGCSSGCPAELITQPTSDRQKFN
jgi:hypothetical protein